MKILGPPTAGPGRVGYNLAARRATPLFVDIMLPPLWDAAVDNGINPVVMVAQAGKETGWGTFAGKVPPTFRNTCGLKIREPTLADDQESTLAHAQFASWEAGAIAHAQHLRAYLQLEPVAPPLLDPRYVWVYGRKPAITDVEQLSGLWAPSPTYGQELAATAAALGAAG